MRLCHNSKTTEFSVLLSLLKTNCDTACMPTIILTRIVNVIYNKYFDVDCAGYAEIEYWTSAETAKSASEILNCLLSQTAGGFDKLTIGEAHTM